MRTQMDGNTRGRSSARGEVVDQIGAARLGQAAFGLAEAVGAAGVRDPLDDDPQQRCVGLQLGGDDLEELADTANRAHNLTRKAAAESSATCPGSPADPPENPASATSLSSPSPELPKRSVQWPRRSGSPAAGARGPESAGNE